MQARTARGHAANIATRKAKEAWIEVQCQGVEENLAEKQHQESLLACERTDKLETKNYYHPGHRRTRLPKVVDRVLFRIVYTHNNNRRSQG